MSELKRKKPVYKEVNFEKAMKDMKKMILETHDVKEIKKYYDYQGEDIKHHSILATNFNIHDSVSRKGMTHNRDQGRDLLDVILEKIFQLGYSQAKIVDGNDPLRNFMIDFAEKQIENLSKAQEEQKKE